jgi:outer membrane protein OmpA-like peptidoglycan-associated protein
MLGDIELQHVQKIEVDEDQVLIQHGVPALEGDFLQGLGRRATQISLVGVLTGSEAGDGLNTLRDKFRAAEPVSFVADITTAIRVDQVLIEEMGVRELAGKPERFEYAFTLREYIPAPEPERPQPPPETPPSPSVDTGTLIIEVIVEGQPGFDFSTVTVTVEGTQEDGTTLSRTLTNRAENIWTEDEFPPGHYTVRAVVTEPEAMSGSASATVRAGQTEHVTITLRPGQIIAKAFMIHFWFDKAFIEPCMRAVMRQIAEYTQSHPEENLVIVGHTDESGSAQYNQSLSERRARSAYAYLTFGRAAAAALDEWDHLRQTRPRGVTRSINDTWGARQYQYMLQDLGYYLCNVNDIHTPGDMTDDAVRDFQGDNGLVVDGIVGDQTWRALIEAYLSQDSLAVPENQFLPNCEDEILKWLGCEEKMPVDSTPRGLCPEPAWRPNRRTEFLFVKADALPCQVPKPDTFELPPPGITATRGAAGTNWCLGPGERIRRCCFITRDPDERDKWLVQDAEPGTITVRGSIRFEDGTPLTNAEFVLITPDGPARWRLYAGDSGAVCRPRGRGATRGSQRECRLQAVGR